ncbi:aminopeptidase P family protein [Acholeplasma sp. OttesenSCG-928-E16]|nr:aminopeptidase P family protein [Acholeplasma sp. OttesenSCG-928-E16]
MYNKRRNNIFKTMNDNSAMLLFSGNERKMSADASYPFYVNNNFYYLTGINQSEVALLLIKGKHSKITYLFLDETSELEAKWNGSGLTYSEASKISGVDIKYLKPYKEFENILSTYFIPSRRNQIGVIDTLFLDLERDSFEDEKQISHHFAERVLSHYYNIDIKDCFDSIALLRMIKDDHEIELTKKAIAITKEGINALMKKAKPGINEYNLEAEFNYVLDNNNVKPSFDTIAAAGKNATVLHYVSNDTMINDNELILFDLGVRYQQYCSDISRTFPVNGKFTKRQKEIYEIVLNCNKKTIEWLHPGVSFQEFLDYGRNLLIEGCKKIGLIKEDDEINKYYYHGLGHFLGLDVHDVGYYSNRFESGIIITVEPGLYIEEEGIGIRIEDDILITDNGCINLSKDIIKEVDEIEAFMKK